MDIEEIEDNDYTFDDEHPDFEDTCELCGDPSTDLDEVESCDPSTGHRQTGMLCPKCRQGRK